MKSLEVIISTNLFKELCNKWEKRRSLETKRSIRVPHIRADYSHGWKMKIGWKENDIQFATDS